jgi:hypothetical protein
MYILFITSSATAFSMCLLVILLQIYQLISYSRIPTTRFALKQRLDSITRDSSYFPLQASSTANSADIKPGEVLFPDDMSAEWELDCYSRPVVGDDGKKLWEVLITDSEGSFRYLKPLPSNVVNSRNLRKVVEELMESSPVKPKVIRFFRNQMFNMITIALSNLDVDVKPSRRTHNLFMWLQDREQQVYPKMKGYNPQLRQQSLLDYDVSQPDRLPDVLRAQAYAFVALPANVFRDGQVNKDNINRGRLCPLRDMPESGWIHGITLFSKRSESIAAWMSGLEITYLRADLLSRELMIHCDISTQYILAPILEAQKKEAQIFEKGKLESSGYHFLSIQESPESEEVDGFWLLRQFDDSL